MKTPLRNVVDVRQVRHVRGEAGGDTRRSDKANRIVSLGLNQFSVAGKIYTGRAEAESAARSCGDD
jgi:hypothetical protein